MAMNSFMEPIKSNYNPLTMGFRQLEVGKSLKSPKIALVHAF
jgi:hypothetical protein